MFTKVSILLSVFNGEMWIDKVIDNVLEQDFQNYEFIIVNDGSTDATEDKILNYIKKNKKIKYFPKNHTGLTDSLNYGLSMAIGIWIARIDVDDISKKERLSKQIKYVEKNKNIVLLGSNFTLRKKDAIVYKSNLPSDGKSLLYRLKHMKGFFPHSSAFFSRKKALQVGGYRKQFKKSQDHDLWLRLSEVGEIACCNEHLVEINDHPQRISNSKLGFPQYIYAFSSITAHYLRISDHKSLEKKFIGKNFEDFLTNVNNYLVVNNFYKVDSLKKEFKNKLNESNNYLLILNLVKLIRRNKYFFFLMLKIAFFGTNLPYKFYLQIKNQFHKNLKL